MAADTTEEVVHPEDVEHPAPPAKDRLVAWIATKCATVEFALGCLAGCLAWVGASVEPFPYALLTLVLSVLAIELSVFVLVQQRIMTENAKRESDADLKNDAIAAEESRAAREQLDRIEAALKRLKGR